MQLPLFIFLPGMDGSGRLLYRQLEGLESRFSIACLSLPGNDFSNWERLVQQVVSLIQAERGDGERPVYLCGESFGGCLAMKLVVAQPDLFDTLILVNPASSFNQIPLFKWGSPLSNLLPAPLYSLSSRVLAQLLIEPERVADGERQALVDAMLQVAPKTAAWRLYLLRQFDLETMGLEGINLPTLLIAGLRDRLLPSAQEVARISQYLAQAETCLLSKSGHTCLLEREVNLGHILQQKGFVASASEAL